MLAGVPSTITLHFALRVNRGEEIVRYSFGDLDPIQSNVGAVYTALPSTCTAKQ